MVNTTDTFRIAIEADTHGAERSFGELTDAANTFASSVTRAFEDVAIRGRSLGDAISSIALGLSRASLRSALQPLESSIASAVTGIVPSLGGLFANAFGAVGFAKGGIVSSPVATALGGGRLGVIGEAGPEAVLPLARGPDGRLGVRAGAGSAPVSITFNVASPDAAGFVRSEPQITAMLARAVARGRRGL